MGSRRLRSHSDLDHRVDGGAVEQNSFKRGLQSRGPDRFEEANTPAEYSQSRA